MTKDTDKFSGGVAVITGAGAGIGASIARRCGVLGMTVIASDVSSARAEETASKIREAGGQAEANMVDVSNPEELDRLAEYVFDRHGSVRLLVNNAGIETLGYSWEISAARWEKTLNTNVHGVVHGVRAFVPKMLASGQECWITNVSSPAAFSQIPLQTAYVMTKHAVQALSECLFLEMQVKKAPIHVSCVIPGLLKTSIFEPEAGEGEPEGASVFRNLMREGMYSAGMDVHVGCERIVDSIAANQFWVDSQPEITADFLTRRAAFLQDKQEPVVPELLKQMMGL